MARQPLTDGDREHVAEFTRRHWGSPFVMSRGRKYFPHELEGVIDRREGQIVGLMTFRIDEVEGMEIMTLNSVLEGRGIGMSLILDATQIARQRGVTRIWLTTTNDNLRAIGLYQRIGFRIIQVNVGAADEARKIKPSIPIRGYLGIEIHDEIVMELKLEPFLEAHS